MADIHKSLTDLIGNTPLVEVVNIEKSRSLKARILAKLEYFNPGGSVKDRVAFAMIKDAETRGQLRPGGLIVEPTSGNTGIGLAWIGRRRGYRVMLTMPDTMSVERRNMLKALGAELILTPGAEGMPGAIRKAQELLDAHRGAFMPRQFDNPANPECHRRTTAQEIWRDTAGAVDILVACVGTGGTVCGTGRGLKEHNPDVEVVAVEPAGSPVLAGGRPGPHKIQGIGAGFIPTNYDASVVDKVLAVSDDDAFAGSRMLASSEGIFAGISSGAALQAALRLAADEANVGKTIVTIIPDTGDRYLSTLLFA